MKIRQQSKRHRLISELASIQRVQAEKPSWFKAHDYDSLCQAWAAKSADLVELEVKTYRRKRGW